MNRSQSTEPTRCESGHAIPEFALGLIVLMFLVMFPLINLLAVGISAASIGLLAGQAAVRASSQQDFPAALNAVKSEALGVVQSGIAKFCKMQPIDGYQSCGVDLCIQATDIHTHHIVVTAANQPLSKPPDALSNVYEYTATAKYQVSPLVPMGSIPFVREVPGVGKPVIITFNSSRALEHLTGLSKEIFAVGFTSPAQKGPYPGRDNTAPKDLNLNDGIGWNYPNIYTLIEAKGQKIVSEDVFVVPGNSEPWIISNCIVSPSQHVWIDSHSEGTWNVGGGQPNVDANGLANSASGVAPIGSLVSQVGPDGPMYFAGKTLLDYVPQTTGPVEFRMNDLMSQFTDNTGEQVVRVIVTNKS